MFQNKLIFFCTFVCFSFGLCNVLNAQLISDDSSVVKVYSSSLDGDRLVRNPDNHFSKDFSARTPVKIDDKQIFQEIEGFGATFNEAGMICLNSLPKKDQNNLLESLFDSVKGAGYTLMKSPIAACDFASAGPWYTYETIPNDTLMKSFTIARDLKPNGLISFIKNAKEYGNFKIESPMDFAPDWMYYSLKQGEKHIKPEYFASLARYYSKYLQSYANAGVKIDYLDLFNEADNTWYSNETYREIGELIRGYVAPQLQEDGLATKIQFGESSDRPEGIKKFPSGLDLPGVRERVNSLTVHGYDWDKFSSLTELHNRYPDLPIWMTEVCYAYSPTVNNIPPGGPTKMPVYGFKDGEFWGNMIMNDMKNWVSGWIYWNMILDETGGPWLISVKHGDPVKNAQHPVVIIDRKSKKVTYTGLYYYLAHFSKFVRPGAHRIYSSDSKNAQLNLVAFKNEDGTMILNVINNGNATPFQFEWNSKMVTQNLKAHSITTFLWPESPQLQ